MTTKHYFPDTESAYDESQCNDLIKDGDILVTPRTVGVLVEAWPVVVHGLNGERGQFHRLEGHTWETFEGGKYAAAAAEALELAQWLATLSINQD